MKYNFDTKIDNYLPHYCMSCGFANRPLERHHIKGRKNDNHSSYLNAIMLCKKCHDLAVCNDELSLEYMRKTFKLLHVNHYKLKQKDLDFMHEYKNLYVIIIQEIFGPNT